MGKKDSFPDGSKDRVPPSLRQLLNLDMAITNKLCSTADNFLPQVLRSHLKAAELSCNAILWLVLWFSYIFLWNDALLHELQINFLVGFILDFAVVAVMKAFTRRRTPVTGQSDKLPSEQDKFSFPSGHASRASYISHFFVIPYNVLILKYPLMIWCLAVCSSTVLLRRHYILDVMAGMFLGIIESWFLAYFWLSQDTCSWIISVLSF